jgi:hypothetical protein
MLDFEGTEKNDKFRYFRKGDKENFRIIIFI